jgi:hypothetical protein
MADWPAYFIRQAAEQDREIRAALAQPAPEGDVTDEDAEVDFDKIFYQHAQRQDENFQPLMDVQSFSEACAAIDLALSRRAPVQVADGEVAELVAALSDPCIAPLLRERIRAALAQPEPAGEVTDEELHAFWDTGFEGDFQDCRRFFREAVEHFAFRRRAPQVAGGEVMELVNSLRHSGDALRAYGLHGGADDCTRAADLLQHHQPPQSVLVSERLQQMEDLAGDAVSALRYIEAVHGRLYGVGWNRVYEKADRLQPSQAMPIPPSEND